jgi:hypothetical protein
VVGGDALGTVGGGLVTGAWVTGGEVTGGLVARDAVTIGVCVTGGCCTGGIVAGVVTSGPGSCGARAVAGVVMVAATYRRDDPAGYRPNWPAGVSTGRKIPEPEAKCEAGPRRGNRQKTDGPRLGTGVTARSG